MNIRNINFQSVVDYINRHYLDGTYMKLDSDAEIGPINLDVENQTAIIEGPYGAAEILRLNPSTLRSQTRKLGIKRPRVHNQPTSSRIFHMC